MTDELKPEVIKKTQETLGKFIKKPVLTEKLLTKPPFRFLHDICTAAMRETGFFEGVLSPTDCKADNIKDKDGKIAFLQKVIAAVEAANGNKLLVKPNKVVAGHEPQRTNEFLQALAKALENQVGRNNNSNKPKPDPAKTKTKSTTKRSEKDEPALKKKVSSTRIAKVEKNTDAKTSEESKTKASSEKTAAPSKIEKEKKSQISPPKDRENVDKPSTQVDEAEKTSKRREKNKLKTSQAASNESPESADDKVEEKQDIKSERVQKFELDQMDMKRPVSAKPGHRKSLAISESTEPVAVTEPSTINEGEQDEMIKTDTPISKSQIDQTPKRPDSNFMRLNRQNSNSSSVPVGYSIKDSDAVDDSSPISRPLTSIRPTTGRPASARPAAPRIRDRGEIQVHEDVVKQSMGNVQIITDKNEGNEPEEDDNVVVVEPETELTHDELDRTDEIDQKKDTTDGEHGLLVEQILETQKELDQSRMQIIDNKVAGKTEIEWKSSRNREATDREVKKLRLSIQTLTRSANPLGKLLTFLQEDVDIMQKELTKWKEMNANLDIQIDQERSLTEQSVEPLKVHLKELQQNIDQQLEQMSFIKANILRNDEKIHKLLTDVK